MPASLEHAAGRRRPQHLRQVVDAAGRELQPVRAARQAAGVGDRRHLDRRLGAVEEGVEHLRVHAGRRASLGGQAVMAPDVSGVTA